MALRKGQRAAISAVANAIRAITRSARAGVMPVDEAREGAAEQIRWLLEQLDAGAALSQWDKINGLGHEREV